MLKWLLLESSRFPSNSQSPRSPVSVGLMAVPTGTTVEYQRRYAMLSPAQRSISNPARELLLCAVIAFVPVAQLEPVAVSQASTVIKPFITSRCIRIDTSVRPAQQPFSPSAPSWIVSGVACAPTQKKVGYETGG